MVGLYTLAVGLTITRFVEATTTSKKIPELCRYCGDWVVDCDFYVCPTDSFIRWICLCGWLSAPLAGRVAHELLPWYAQHHFLFCHDACMWYL